MPCSVHVGDKILYLSCSFERLLAVEVVLTLSQGNHSVRLLVHLELNGSTNLHIW